MVLKRKAGTLNLSNQKSNYGLGFSLNNPRRLAHREGQTQTLCRGTAARGHGNINQIVLNKSQYIFTDLFNIPHVSVKNNQGMLSTRNKWLKRGYPYTVVKDCTPPGYDTYLNKIKGNVAKGNNSDIKGTCTGTSTGNYQKDILSMNYDIYYSSNIFVKNCIPLPANKAHYPPQNVKSSNSCFVPTSVEDFITENETKTDC